MPITNYEVWYNTTGGPVTDANGTQIPPGQGYGAPGNFVSYPHTHGLDAIAAGNPVYYGIRSVSDDVPVQYSDWAQAVAPGYVQPNPPPPVSATAVANSPIQNTITWVPPADVTDVVFYDVYYSLTTAVTAPTSFSLGSVAVGTNTINHDKSLTVADEASPVVYYGVFSRSSVGLISTAAQCFTQKYVYSDDPSGFTGTAYSATQTVLTWTDSLDLTVIGYTLYYNLTGGAPFSTADEIITGLSPGTGSTGYPFTLDVAAQAAPAVFYGLEGRSTSGETVTVLQQTSVGQFSSIPPPPPIQPTSATTGSPAVNTVSWTPPADITDVVSYEIFYSNTGPIYSPDPTHYVGSSPVGTNTIQHNKDVDAETAATVYYGIFSRNADGIFSTFGEHANTARYLFGDAPTNPTGRADSLTQSTIQWTDALDPYVASYDIHYTLTDRTVVATDPLIIPDGNVPDGVQLAVHTLDALAQGASEAFYGIVGKSASGATTTTWAEISVPKYGSLTPPPPVSATATTNSLTQNTVDWIPPLDLSDVGLYEIYYSTTAPVITPSGPMLGPVPVLTNTVVHPKDITEQSAPIIYYSVYSKSPTAVLSLTGAQAQAPMYLVPPPISAAAVTNTPEQNTVTWVPPTVTADIASYDVFYSLIGPVTAPTGTSAGSATVGTNTLTHAKDANAEGAATVYYGVFSKSTVGGYSATGASASTAAYVYTVAPTAFSGLNVDPTQNTLSWTDATDTNVKLYSAFYNLTGPPATAADSPVLATQDIAAGVGAGTHLLDTAAQAATEIFYGLLGTSASGVTVTPTLTQTSVKAFAPDPPITPSTTTDSPKQNTVRWAPPVDLTGVAEYEVFYEFTGGAVGTSIGTVPVGTHLLVHNKDAAAEAAPIIYYSIYSKSSIGTYSTTAALTTAAAYVFTSDPINLVMVTQKATQTVMAWTDSTDPFVASYDLHYNLTAAPVVVADPLVIAGVLPGVQTATHTLDAAAQAAAMVYYGVVGKS